MIPTCCLGDVLHDYSVARLVPLKLAFLRADRRRACSRFILPRRIGEVEVLKRMDERQLLTLDQHMQAQSKRISTKPIGSRDQVRKGCTTKGRQYEMILLLNSIVSSPRLRLGHPRHPL